MKNILIIVFLFVISNTIAQQDSTTVYKKRVLETAEVDFLTSYYTQDGDNAAVTGGIGTEKLTDFTPTIIVSLPLNADDVLTVDAGISTYSSASSSNLNPFDGSKGASPWVASSGASQQDTWGNVNVGYAHSSEDRNEIWNANVSFATEYDYTSVGFGGGFAKLFNQKNTEIGVKANVYLDAWSPKYPTELDAYVQTNGNLNQGFFQDIEILDQNGNVSTDWSPVTGFGLIKDKSRNSYSLSFIFSQILSKKAQMSLFFDLVKQEGWLANPMQRVYFADVDNYYVGNADNISSYTSSSNREVFQLADDIERLPDSRFKIPLGLRFNYYLNETVSLRTYYRYYYDDWGINSHTLNLEVPIKITSKFTLYPSYRFYNQTEADYFAPYEENLSTSEFYTSDYDLSKFSANQYGFGVSYTDIFTKFNIWKLGLKNVDFKYNNYKRNTGLSANIFAIAFKFVMY
ncbi:DUF3570 domain-containing protein [Lacinutrix sp. C3R15]|uniref:DUF3570 domain-containing protein n=1 Tax=Flavobacteriaceae TaxID=49546 RepID=UPI001C08DCDE|nr:MULTISPECIES: DUF3570 domain-containing protein [Flavobacteriaceae]MBU2940191.1 DUF3570 domain-containing protein [Lacinutrix sp. C3R15]MDO6623508.1 DUF3570 domain-containing protein [Oceanihabitans sp. 1_MG-2023]